MEPTPECKYLYVHDYLAFVRRAFAMAKAGHMVPVQWGVYYRPDRWHSVFMLALNKRINLKGGIRPTGRKHDPDYQIAQFRDAQAVNAYRRSRVRFYSLETPELRSRCGHLICDRNEI